MPVGDDTVEQLPGVFKTAGGILLFAESRFDLFQFFSGELAEQINGDFSAVGEDAFGVVDPLPDLGAGDFDGGGIFHEVVDGNAAEAI